MFERKKLKLMLLSRAIRSIHNNEIHSLTFYVSKQIQFLAEVVLSHGFPSESLRAKLNGMDGMHVCDGNTALLTISWHACVFLSGHLFALLHVQFAKPWMTNYQISVGAHFFPDDSVPAPSVHLEHHGISTDFSVHKNRTNFRRLVHPKASVVFATSRELGNKEQMWCFRPCSGQFAFFHWFRSRRSSNLVFIGLQSHWRCE